MNNRLIGDMCNKLLENNEIKKYMEYIKTYLNSLFIFLYIVFILVIICLILTIVILVNVLCFYNKLKSY